MRTKMKIGVVTYWQSLDNYGQQLQCWALQRYLKKKGHSPFLIRYNYSERPFIAPLWKLMIKIILVFPYLRQLKTIKQKEKYKKTNTIRRFEQFRSCYLNLGTKVYNSIEELKNNPPQADVYLAGSDQIWNRTPDQEHFKAFFLQFGDEDIRRVSYAPSFAMQEYPEHYKPILKEALCKFDSISVREKRGVEICKEVGVNVSYVIDPTLLLSKEDYNSIISHYKSSVSFIYIYSINIKNNEEIRWNEISAEVKTRKMDVIVTTASGYIEGKEIFGGDVKYDYATIPGWLNNIDNCRLMITTSFHGVVFSLLFHTPVVYVPLKGKYSGGNNRAEELLEKVGLEDWILSDDKPISYYFGEKVDWSHIDDKLSELRASSINYLDSSLMK